MSTEEEQLRPIHEPPPLISYRPGDQVLIPTLQDILTADPDPFVAKYTDIAAVNLACAEGLATSQPIDFPQYLALLDKMAAAVRVRVEKTARLFKLKPAEYNHSENVFRVMTMEHVLRVGFGVKYDDVVYERTKSGKPRDTTDSTELFIHGILSEKRTGTCSTLPVFAVAIGRRCGYPLYFARVPNHGIYRWHDDKEKFNYQHTFTGGDMQPDDFYHTWPVPWDESDFALNARTKVWLHSMTARQEVSKFLCNRALALRAEKRYQEALKAIDAAERFDPINPACGDIGYDICMKMGGERVESVLSFPQICIAGAPLIMIPTPTAIQVAKPLPQPVALRPLPHDLTPAPPARMAPHLTRTMPQFPGAIPQPFQQNREIPK